MELLDGGCEFDYEKVAKLHFELRSILDSASVEQCRLISACNHNYADRDIEVKCRDFRPYVRGDRKGNQGV